MLQPGLTGWAQVCYPYGASIDDAKCKLEYDLYYLKYASVLFDSLILLDTVRVVLGGGLKSNTRQRYSKDIDFDLQHGDAPLMEGGNNSIQELSTSVSGLAEVE